ncbi:MAG TPA: hypothetical protein VGR21_05230 [Cryptosporangiaceae bacterium]|nr:hypothetical protein [Cryptosporangiaceae bacterium]
MTSDREPAARLKLARHLVAAVHGRAALDEAVGVLRYWGDCGAQQARQQLYAGHGARGRQIEAARVAAVVDAAADRRGDPEWD